MYQPSDTPDYRPAPLELLVYAAVNKKNRSAFAVIYERYQERLASYLLRIVNNRENVDEIVQDTFVIIWERIQQERVSQEKIGRFVAWLYKIATNRAFDCLRRNKKFEFISLSENESNELMEYALAMHPHLSVPGHEEQVCNRLLLEQAVAAMSPQYQVCYLLRVKWDFTLGEIAEILDISEKTVSTNIRRGFLQLHKIYTMMLSEHDATMKGGRKRYGKINLRAL